MEKTFREQVIGTWKLLKYTREDKNGEHYYPLGKDATGFLMYTDDGYMSAQLMAQGRSAYTLGELHKGTTEEMAEAARVTMLTRANMKLMKRTRLYITIWK